MKRTTLICIFLILLLPFSSSQASKRKPLKTQEVVKPTDPQDIQSTIGSYMSSILSRSVETISEGVEVVSNKAGELGKSISVGAEASIDKTNYGELAQQAILKKVHEIGNPLEGVTNTLSNVFNKLDPTETILEWLKKHLDAQLEHIRQLIIEAFAKIETEWLKLYIDTQIETLQELIINLFTQMVKRITLDLPGLISEIATSISNTVIETLWTIAYYLLGTYLLIKCTPIIIKRLFKHKTQDKKASSTPYLELKGDQFKIEDLHVTVDRVPYNTAKCFLKFFLHYTVQHFNRDDGNVIILISTFVEDSLKQSHTVTIPAAKFSISSVYKACSFREPIELDVEKVKIKVNILFQSNTRRTLSICKGVFDIVLKPLNTKKMEQSYKDSTVRFFIRTIYAILESSVLFGSQPEKVLLISEMKKEDFAKS